jgi:hypothetical protein
MWLNEIEMIKHFFHEMFEYVFWLIYLCFKKCTNHFAQTNRRVFENKIKVTICNNKIKWAK